MARSGPGNLSALSGLNHLDDPLRRSAGGHAQTAATARHQPTAPHPPGLVQPANGLKSTGWRCHHISCYPISVSDDVAGDIRFYLMPYDETYWASASLHITYECGEALRDGFRDQSINTVIDAQEVQERRHGLMAHERWEPEGDVPAWVWEVWRAH